MILDQARARQAAEARKMFEKALDDEKRERAAETRRLREDLNASRNRLAHATVERETALADLRASLEETHRAAIASERRAAQRMRDETILELRKASSSDVSTIIAKMNSLAQAEREAAIERLRLEFQDQRASSIASLKAVYEAKIQAASSAAKQSAFIEISSDFERKAQEFAMQAADRKVSIDPTA